MIAVYHREASNPYIPTTEELAAIDAASENIEKNPHLLHDDDCPLLTDEFFLTAKRVYPQTFNKTRVTVRLDSDVLLWLKSYGTRYQTRLNTLLRLAMQADKNHV